MKRYRFTGAADRDFQNIFEFGIQRFGLANALSYQRAMMQRFVQLSERPKLYPAVDHVRKGYRRSVFNSHSIYYRVDNGIVIITRILGRENTDISLPE